MVIVISGKWEYETGLLRETQAKMSPELGMSNNFTLFLDASLVIVSPHAK